MTLELGRIYVKEVEWGNRTSIEGTRLYINREEFIRKSKAEDARIVAINAEIARPGESVRIVPVKDVIEPRVKVEGKGGMFPGFIAETERAGTGRTNVLQGCAVVTTGQIVGFQEGIIDMNGPGAELTSFSKLINVVLEIKVSRDINRHEHEECIRLAGIRAAAYLGEAARFTRPDKVESFESPEPYSTDRYAGLPRVAYVYNLLSQGLLHDTYVYGRNVKNMLPTFISPTEVMDGAIVSGNCVSACDKNTTYHHQNNPIIEELYRHNGVDLNFIGIIITPENVTLKDKVIASDCTARLVKMLRAGGVIISKEGFGNPDADAMMLCSKIEKGGTATVLITDEFAGADGLSQSLADFTDEANAVISTGNANEIIKLPPMEKVIGDIKVAEKIAGGISGGLSGNGDVSVELQTIVGATNELGYERLSCREL